MDKLDKIDEFARTMGYKLLPWQRELFEKAIESGKPLYISMVHNHGRSMCLDFVRELYKVLMDGKNI